MKPPNRLNSDFQIAYFLAGACHTPDGAYATLCSLKENREMALEEAATELVHHQDQTTIAAQVFMRNYNAAVAELATINRCIDLIQPLRKYKDLPDAEAHEAAQAEEWKLELIARAENQILTTGTISPDQLATMRLHPEFKAEIWPAIKNARSLVLAGDLDGLVMLGESRQFKLEFKK